MKASLSEIVNYDFEKLNNERDELGKRFSHIWNNFKNNTPRPPRITKKGKATITEYQLPWEKELYYFVYDLINCFTYSKNIAYEINKEADKYYSELARCNQAYSPSVIRERKIFLNCDMVYDHGFTFEEDGIKLTRTNEFGKKRTLDEILWFVVKGEKYKPYCNRGIKDELFQRLYKSYLKYRSAENKNKQKQKK
ncbi:MAG: hypothetical protein C0412_18225 [Flavobacterium sp.]|nr:hypothetical protein [Flavobacterium sp.]